jgi:mannose-1-phosphate guanylyltransferase
MTENTHYFAVILAGGAGSRLWPKSRAKTPKHLLRITGNKTMLQNTYNRIVPLIPAERIFVITNQAHLAQAKEQLPDLPESNFIAEPQAKNTAMAMGVAAAFVKKRDEKGVIVNLAADHTYKDEEKFRQVVHAALQVAEDGENLVAIGIKPTFAHTGLGYIRIGEELKEVGQGSGKVFVFKSRGFKEKPDLATAQSFIATKQYQWNANNYVWSAQACLDAFAKHAPELSKNLEKIYQAIGTPDQKKVMDEEYQECINEPVDTAISEKVDNLVVIPGDFGWSDIGDWRIVYDSSSKDNLGNAILNEGADSVMIDARDNLIESNGKMIAVVGLSDIIVIESDNAILICKKDRTQDVKKVVEKLKEEKKGQYL